MKKEKRYRVTMTESQLRLMANAVEDWSRFLAGQCSMNYATGILENSRDAQKNLNIFVRPYVVPELKDPGCSWNWDGGGCPNKHQRKAIAMSYMIYRQVVHYLTTHNGKDMSWNCYSSPTLTCPEQGPLIHIEEESAPKPYAHNPKGGLTIKEDKLERMKKLADAMYYAAQYLTDNAAPLHRAMEDYHNFIIIEYLKE